MPVIHFQESHQPKHHVREEFEPGALPIDPDEGPGTVPLPGDPGDEHDIDDPERESTIGPDVNQGARRERARHSVEGAECR